MAWLNHSQSSLALFASIGLCLALGCGGGDADRQVSDGTDAPASDIEPSESDPTTADDPVEKDPVEKDNAPPVDIAAVPTDNGAATLPPSEPELTISLPELVKAFQDDSAAANKQYTGKIIEVEALVSDATEKGFDGKLTAMLGMRDEDGDLETVAECKVVESDEETAKMIWGGNTVKVVGKCLGYTYALMMADCRIVDAGAPVEFLDVTAQEVLDEFAADLDAANEKYVGKNLRITGVVALYDPSEQKIQVRGENETSDKPIRFDINYGKAHEYKLMGIEEDKPIMLEITCGRKSSINRRVPVDFWRVAKDS